MSGARTELSAALAALEHRASPEARRSALRDLPRLYRSVVAELAEARARGLPRRELLGLEALVLRAHALLYAPERPRLGAALWDLLSAFPREVRRSLRLLALATALLVAGTVLGYLEVERDPSSAAVLLPGSWRGNAEESFREDAPKGEGDPLYGAFYFTNNAQVALKAYALGGTFGVGTALMLLFNGVILGATFSVVTSVGSPRAFFSFVLPHAGVELFAILIAAAGGLRIATGLLRPGWLRRREAFALAARESLPLALGAAGLLAVAGIVEGWISPQPLPIATKAVIGVTLDVLLAAYLFFWPDAPRSREVPGSPGAQRH